MNAGEGPNAGVSGSICPLIWCCLCSSISVCVNVLVEEWLCKVALMDTTSTHTEPSRAAECLQVLQLTQSTARIQSLEEDNESWHTTHSMKYRSAGTVVIVHVMSMWVVS